MGLPGIAVTVFGNDGRAELCFGRSSTERADRRGAAITPILAQPAVAMPATSAFSCGPQGDLEDDWAHPGLGARFVRRW